MDGLILLGILLAQQIANQATDPLQIEASVAFGGHVSASKFTELRVLAASPAGGTLILDTVGGSPNVSFSLDLRSGETTKTWAPLGIDFSNQSPAIRATLGRAKPQKVALNTIRHSTPWSALVGTLASQLLLEVPDTESVSGTTLPRFSPAYGQISALAIGGPTLATLDDSQLRSLLEFVGSCGRLMLIDVSESVEQIFVNRAACEGRFFKSVDSGDNAEAAYRKLLEQRLLTFPSDEQLGGLLSDTSDGDVDLTRLSLFWAGYLLVLALLMFQARTRIAGLGFSIVSTVLVLVIWPAAISRAYVAWAEASFNDRVARYAALERYSAARRGTFMLPADPFGTHPTIITGSNYSFQWNAETDQSYVVWDTPPFQQIDSLTRGSFTIDTTLRAEIRENIVSVCNSGIRASREAFLHWQGGIFAIPSIAPGTTWSSADHTALDAEATASSELQLLLIRSSEHNMTMLQSLPVFDGDKTERAWLLRYESDQTGDSPCGR